MNIFQQTIKHFPFLFGQQFCVLEMFTVTFHTDISHLAQLSPWFPGEFWRQSRRWWRHHWQWWGSTKGWQIPYDLRNSAPSQNDAWKASALSEMHTHTHSDTHIKKTYTLLSQRQVLFSSIQNGLEKLMYCQKHSKYTHTHTLTILCYREKFSVIQYKMALKSNVWTTRKPDTISLPPHWGSLHHSPRQELQQPGHMLLYTRGSPHDPRSSPSLLCH